MNMFVQLKYARKDDTDENKYIIKYKSIKNTLEKFTEEIIESQAQQANALFRRHGDAAKIRHNRNDLLLVPRLHAREDGGRGCWHSL